MASEDVEQQISERSYILGGRFGTSRRVDGVAPELDPVSHSYHVARVNGRVDQVLGVHEVQPGQDGPKNFERVGFSQGTLVESRLEGLVGALKNGVENRFSVVFGVPGVEQRQQVGMSKAGYTTPQGELQSGRDSACGNESEHCRAGIRAIRGSEKGSIFRLFQVLLKEVLACKNDALQTLPSRSHANTNSRFRELPAGSTLPS
jgi:hypothetical protein